MSWRTRHLWTIGGAIALAILLIIALHPSPHALPASGMSAPPPASPVIESASLAGGSPSAFASNAPELVTDHLAIPPPPARPLHDTPRVPSTLESPYGPLYRRPPPL